METGSASRTRATAARISAEPRPGREVRMDLWHVILFIDSEHHTHGQLCQVVSELMPERSSIEPPTRPIGRYYCAVWRRVAEEELKPFFYRLLDGDLKACKKYILALNDKDVGEVVERCMKSVERRRVDAESMWVELKRRQPREANFD
jgi:hypothetical protein